MPCRAFQRSAGYSHYTHICATPQPFRSRQGFLHVGTVAHEVILERVDVGTIIVLKKRTLSRQKFVLKTVHLVRCIQLTIPIIYKDFTCLGSITKSLFYATYFFTIAEVHHQNPIVLSIKKMLSI